MWPSVKMSFQPSITVLITEWENIGVTQTSLQCFDYKTDLNSVAFLQRHVCRCLSREKNPPLQFARPQGKCQWNKWLQAFLRLFTRQTDKPKPNQSEPAASVSAVYSSGIQLSPLSFFRAASSLSADAPHGANKVLIHCYSPCLSARGLLQKFGWPGCRQRARQGCNSTVNRWHTPFLSLLFPQSLRPGATGSPKSAPIKTPVRWVEGGACGESNGSNPTLMRQQQTKHCSLKNKTSMQMCSLVNFPMTPLSICQSLAT